MITLTEVEPIQFEEFPKISRLSRECVITEKIDGTNAQIFVDDSSSFIKVGSRTRWLSDKEDNHGFYRWAMEHREELLKLGPGRHFGEWWGSGIQRGYGLIKGDKRFSLFNVGRWNAENVPSCVSVVPTLFRGLFDSFLIEETLDLLRVNGSAASPGFMKPEGVVIFHTASGGLFKKTLEKDEAPKSLVKEQV